MAVRGAVLAVASVAATVTMLAAAGPASAEPEPAAPDGPPPAVAAALPDAAAPDPEAAEDALAVAAVDSSPEEVTTAPDGSRLAISARDETQEPIAPLTTAISTREYAVGGVFNGKLEGAGAEPEGVFEVGYQIGCGIDMLGSNGVSLTGTAGVSPSIGFIGLDFPNVVADGILPGIAGTFNGAVTVGLKPGVINVVPVTKKEYKGDEPWVSIKNFRVKIDGCVGESFIRSYATLTKSTDEGEAILSWYGVTKAV